MYIKLFGNWLTPVIHHGVDIGRAANDPAPVPDASASPHAEAVSAIGSRLVHVVHLGAVEELVSEERDVSEHRAIAARLEQKDGDIGVFGQPGGDRTPGGASPDHHKVERQLRRHRAVFGYANRIVYHILE